MPAAFLMFALAPGRYAAYLPLLRLGKVLEIATVALLFVTGTIRPREHRAGPRLSRAGAGPVARGRSASSRSLDLAVLAGLLRVRTGTDTTGSP